MKNIRENIKSTHWNEIASNIEEISNNTYLKIAVFIRNEIANNLGSGIWEGIQDTLEI